MEQTNCLFESENSNSVKEVKAQRLRRKTLSQFKEEKLRVGKCGDLHVLLLRKDRHVTRYPWGQLLQPSFLSGIQQTPRKLRSYCVCFPSAPVATEPNVSGPAWLTFCSHNFLSAAFASFAWKALTNYKNWKKNWFTVTGCVLCDQSRVSHSRFGCDSPQVHTEKEEPLTANKWQK